MKYKSPYSDLLSVLLCVVLLAILVACTPGNVPASIAPEQPAATISVFNTPTAAPSTTSVGQPTVPAPSPTAINRSESVVQRRCGGNTQPWSGLNGNGRLLFSPWNAPDSWLSTTTDLAASQPSIEVGRGYRADVSPTGESILGYYQNGVPPRFSIWTPLGEWVRDIDWKPDGDKENLAVYNWLDGTHVTVRSVRGLAIVSIETGEVVKSLSYQPDLDIIRQEDAIWISPTLRFLVGRDSGSYPVVVPVMMAAERDGNTIVDVKVAGDDDRAWISGGSELLLQAYGRPGSLYAIDGNGGIRKVLSLSRDFRKFGIILMEASPNGELVALWADAAWSRPTAESHDGLSLFVLDVSKGVVYDYCLTNEQASRTLYTNAVWSPDSAILYTRLDDVSPGIFVNIANGNRELLADEVHVQGWVPDTR